MRTVRIPYPVPAPLILFFAVLGTYAVDNDVFDVWVMLLAGVAGWALRKLGIPEAPIILGLVLGPLFQDHLRRALTLSLGDPRIFVTRPLSALLLGLAALSWVLPALRWLSARLGGRTAAAR